MKDGEKPPTADSYAMLVKHLKKYKIGFAEDADNKTVFIYMTGGKGHGRHLKARISPNDNVLQVLGELPVKVPVKRRAAMMEAVTRATYDMCIGGFDMDVRDGEVRFRAVTLLPDGGPTDAMITECINCTVAMLDRYSETFYRVIYRGVSPEKAVLGAEDHGMLGALRRSPELFPEDGEDQELNEFLRHLKGEGDAANASEDMEENEPDDN
ncbi:MAG: YbjN domain-containing protein [Candidatus Sumerlaeota bacterium]|nr:YbjN domain-containing protein [Candidatus Sumerlaeota bacterium]